MENRMRSLAIAAPLAVLVLAAAACGGDDAGGAAAEPSRTVEVRMVDNAFEPASLEVEAGETVRFELTNDGEAVHEAYIGDAEAQAEHAEGMEQDMGGMAHGGEDEAVVVEPGETGELTYTFDEAGTIQIGCHQPGHYEDGMVLDVDAS